MFGIFKKKVRNRSFVIHYTAYKGDKIASKGYVGFDSSPNYPNLLEVEEFLKSTRDRKLSYLIISVQELSNQDYTDFFKGTDPDKMRK